MYLDSLVMILTEQMERDKRGMHKICCSLFIIWTTASFSLVWRTSSVEVAGKIDTRCVNCTLNAAILCKGETITVIIYFFNSNCCSWNNLFGWLYKYQKYFTCWLPDKHSGIRTESVLSYLNMSPANFSRWHLRIFLSFAKCSNKIFSSSHKKVNSMLSWTFCYYYYKNRVSIEQLVIVCILLGE